MNFKQKNEPEKTEIQETNVLAEIKNEFNFRLTINIRC